MIKLFDAHCHLQDPRIFNQAPKLIKTALENGILHFAVNGVSEKDWHLVKEMSDNYPCIIPSFGLHPWYIMDRTPNWLTCLREFFYANPSAAVGEIGLDKGSHGKTIDFTDQVETFRLQLQLAKDIKRPASVHCVRAFGSAEMVPEFAKLGAYFSLSGFLMAMKETKVKKLLKAVPRDRILLETDAPDALPKLNNLDSLFLVEEQDSVSNEGGPKEMLNHPANIHIVLSYVASLLDLSKEEVADVSYRNAVGLFSYEGSKLQGFSVSVTYDSKALVIDGRKRILQSGSIHYPRATPEMWPGIIAKAKEGGLDVIDTYVFWNYHEPVKGQYYFEGRFDLVKFVKTVQEAGMFVHLRIGPYACAEWNYGGFPLWLHFIPGIQFRTTNGPYQVKMEVFLGKIVSLMKEENLFASQGGPIILAQVENEYGNVERAYGVGGKLYVKWAAETALNFNISVPWVMCSQSDAPDPIINTCNGFYCDTFTPNTPSKPKMWTEDYTGWFLSFGYPIPYRPVEDLAFAVSRFFEKGGTFHNYYMYFGGTNFGRTAGGPLVATSYDYDAPLDEYGSIRQPKWGHLRDLHMAIKQCEEYLVNTDPVEESLGINLEADVYYRTPDDCAAFLANYGSSVDANVTFKGKSYFLPAWSVSILPDCKNVIFNTAKVAGQKSVGDAPSASFSVSEVSLSASPWSWYLEKVGVWSNESFTATSLLEQINTTKDTSDFLWYTTSIEVHEKKDAFLLIQSLGHAALVFLNKKVLAFGYGYHDDASFNITEKISLEKGSNTLDIISMIIGVQNYGPWFDIMGAGLYSVILADLKNAKEDYSSNEWTYQVGTEGETLGLDKTDIANSSLWTHDTSLPVNQSLIWYKSTFVAPEGKGPLSLNLASMGKGQAWVNGQSIGRYWSTFLSPTTGCTDNCDYRGSYDAQKCQKKCGKPAQILYHIPRTWVHSGENLIVLHEEFGGDPLKISVQTRTGQEVCSHVSEHDSIPVALWKPDSDSGSSSQSPQVQLMCDHGWKIESVRFASFGNPKGVCGTFTQGTCHTDVLSIIQQVCIGKQKCWVPVSSAKFGNPCPGVAKSLAIEVLCTA